MLRTLQMNYKNKKEYVDNQYKCTCGEDDNQAHLVTCREYIHLREDLDLSNSDLVTYYQRMIREREEGDRDSQTQ